MVHNLQNGQSAINISRTSMATPTRVWHSVPMAQKDPVSDRPASGTILTQTAIPVPPGSRTVMLPTGHRRTSYSWIATHWIRFTTAYAALAQRLIV
jgi:hypothetical protein